MINKIPSTPFAQSLSAFILSKTGNYHLESGKIAKISWITSQFSTTQEKIDNLRAIIIEVSNQLQKGALPLQLVRTFSEKILTTSDNDTLEKISIQFATLQDIVQKKALENRQTHQERAIPVTSKLQTILLQISQNNQPRVILLSTDKLMQSMSTLQKTEPETYNYLKTNPACRDDFFKVFDFLKNQKRLLELTDYGNDKTKQSEKEQLEDEIEKRINTLQTSELFISICTSEIMETLTSLKTSELEGRSFLTTYKEKIEKIHSMFSKLSEDEQIKLKATKEYQDLKTAVTSKFKEALDANENKDIAVTIKKAPVNKTWSQQEEKLSSQEGQALINKWLPLITNDQCTAHLFRNMEKLDPAQTDKTCFDHLNFSQDVTQSLWKQYQDGLKTNDGQAYVTDTASRKNLMLAILCDHLKSEWKKQLPATTDDATINKAVANLISSLGAEDEPAAFLENTTNKFLPLLTIEEMASNPFRGEMPDGEQAKRKQDHAKFFHFTFSKDGISCDTKRTTLYAIPKEYFIKGRLTHTLNKLSGTINYQEIDPNTGKAFVKPTPQ